MDHYSYPFTASETGAQDQSIGYTFTCTGTCLLQDADVIEGSTLPGNTTAFRDAVVYELQKLHPGSIRYMDASQWCSDVQDEVAAIGNRRWCGASLRAGRGSSDGYNDVLALGNFIGSDVLISVGQLNQPSDWTTLINWLNTSGWIAKYAAAGHKIYLEDGNEAWNAGVGGTLYYGNGLAYGYTLGPNMAAAKAAAGYNPNVVKLVANSWVAPNQGYGPYGWVHNALTVAQGTPNGLPDFVDDAPYMLNYLGNFDTYGSNVATTGAPFLDEWAEDTNIDSLTAPPSNSESMYLNQEYAKTSFGVNTLVYEVNESTLSGVAATQLQLDQIGASVGNALAMAEHVLLMQRDSQVTGPIHVFTLAEPYTGYTCNGSGCVSGPVMPLWGINNFMATGPGQTPGSANVDRPLAIALEVINNAIGSNSNLMSVTQAGTPTFNYSGGQYQNGSPSIPTNSAVPYVNCFAYSNGQGNWTTLCFNNNLTTAEPVTFAGAGAPTGSVSETIFPGPSNVITDHNEDSYLGSSTAPVVAVPSATTASGATYSLPPASFIALTYTVGGTPTLTTPTFSPGAGTYSGTQTVAISFPSGSIGCVGINTTPTAPTPGMCGAGGTTYTGPITVSASVTVNAIATEVGSINSAVGTATYTVTVPTAATPAFLPAGGTYTTSQSVTISDATAGTTIYYTTNGTTPTTSSSVYGGPITVSSSETLEAIAAETNYSTSAAAAAAYTISTPQAATPTFGPAGGTYTSSQSVAISDATAGTTIYYTTNGTTPTTSSSVYGGPITVSSSETLEAIAVKTGDTTSAVATASYTINPMLPAPTFSPAGGTYTSSQSVSIGDATAGTTIYYTTNGTTPTTSSSVYGGPITVSSSETLEAIAAETNYSTSAAAAAAYTISTPQAATPTFGPAGGTYTSSQSVAISDATAGTTIYYTTNGTTPTTSSSVYGGPITVSSSETLEAIAVKTGDTTSAVATASYTINPMLPAPTFSPAGGTYTSSQSVSIGDATAGTTIYYTTNGTTPTTSSSVYGGPITVSSSETLEAIAAETNYSTSAAATAAYTISTPQAATPTFSPAGGSYTSSQSVTISDATAGVAIYYTTNGNTPTTSSSVYSGPIMVSSSETLQAIAAETGYTTSAAAAAAYTISTPQPATPTFSPAGGTYTSSQSVAISDATAGTTIYYTTNGTTPTTSSSVYSGPVTVPASETLEAIAVESGDTTSAAASAAYTISAGSTGSAGYPTYSVAVNPASLTVTSGQSASTTVLVTPRNSFASPVSFSCSGLPSGALCSFLPATVTPSEGMAQTALTITTSTTTIASRRNTNSLFPGSMLAITLCLFGWKNGVVYRCCWRCLHSA